ncbi:MAG: histidinol-phosphate transaminase [Novosphingobium sp.]|nr:histidinol-phosphate transaminase [Novosphingobium sp.]
MSRYWSKLVCELRPYVSGEQPQGGGIVKLNTNELPYGPSPMVIRAIQQAASDGLRRYPDPNSRNLCRSIAGYHGLEVDQVFVGNGSDEVLAHAFAAFFDRGEAVLMPDITYGFYQSYCSLFGLSGIQIPLNDGLRVNVEDYRRKCGGVVLANPNAPTGTALDLAGISALMAVQNEAVVVIDEAYVDFGGTTAIPLIADCPNLLVVRTMSKSRGLAGLRIGYALGHRDLVEGLRRVKDSFNSYPLDSIAQAAGEASIADEDYFAASCRKVISVRDHLRRGLERLGFESLPSSANFLFCRHTDNEAGDLAARLRGAGIYVRHFDSPRINSYLRISVGSEGEVAQLLAKLGELLVG